MPTLGNPSTAAAAAAVDDDADDDTHDVASVSAVAFCMMTRERFALVNAEEHSNCIACIDDASGLVNVAKREGLNWGFAHIIDCYPFLTHYSGPSSTSGA